MFFVYFLLSLVGLIFSANKLVQSALMAAYKFNLSKRIVGLTFIALGTSLPEIVTAIFAAKSNGSELAIGNIVGSNIVNIGLVLAVAIIIKPIKINFKHSYYELFGLSIITLAFILISSSFCISRKSALILLSLGLLIGLVLVTKKTYIEKDKNIANISLSTSKIIIKILMYATLLSFCGDLLIKNCFDIAYKFNLPLDVIGLVLVAIGTSLPELVTIILAIIRGESQLVMGSIIGSNICNLSFALSSAILINPTKINAQTFFRDIATMGLFSAFLVSICILNKNKKYIGRKYGGLMFLAFSYYNLFLIGNL